MWNNTMIFMCIRPCPINPNKKGYWLISRFTFFLYGNYEDFMGKSSWDSIVPTSMGRSSGDSMRFKYVHGNYGDVMR